MFLCVSEERDQAVVLGLLLNGGRTATTTDELGAELGWPAYRTDDALGALRRAGLAHVRDDLVFASWPRGATANSTSRSGPLKGAALYSDSPRLRGP